MSDAAKDEAAASVFQQTKRFSAAAQIIESIPGKRLAIIVSRILSSFAEKANPEPFNADERRQLQQVQGFDDEALRTLLDVSLYILEQAAYHRMSGAKLAAQLQAAGLSEKPAAAFGQVWQEGRQPLLERLRNNQFGAPLLLEGVGWRLQLTMAQQGLAQRQHINTLLSLRLRDADRPEVLPELVSVELDPQQLEELFHSLERIQEQLDQLSNQ